MVDRIEEVRLKMDEIRLKGGAPAKKLQRNIGRVNEAFDLFQLSFLQALLFSKNTTLYKNNPKYYGDVFDKMMAVCEKKMDYVEALILDENKSKLHEMEIGIHDLEVDLRTLVLFEQK